MRRFENISGLILLIIFVISSSLFAKEQITITTYYPSPYGIYKELRSQRMAIGDHYYDPKQYCWRDSSIPGCRVIADDSSDLPNDVDLIIEGRVSIGEGVPPGGHKLYVTSSACETPGLCTRTDSVIVGNATGASGSVGVAGSSASNYGVAGSSERSYGVVGQTLSTSSTLAGVYGIGGSTGVRAAGSERGLYAKVDSSLVGSCSDTTHAVLAEGGTYGVQGSGSLAGVYGISVTRGVHGTSDDGVGVYGYSDRGLAGYFAGPVGIDGTINPGGTTEVYRLNSSSLLLGGYSIGGTPGSTGDIPYTGIGGSERCLKVRGGIVIGTGIYPGGCGALPD
ncbi:hypothetical protein D4R78_02310 [bacterium]|nr:MAG: hypothetical protein D4R78_02310 [bacterium]